MFALYESINYPYTVKMAEILHLFFPHNIQKSAINFHFPCRMLEVDELFKFFIFHPAPFHKVFLGIS